MRPYDRPVKNDFFNRMMNEEIMREERITRVIQNHFGTNAWPEWANFCRLNPEFRHFSRGIAHQVMHIEQNEIPSSTMINIFEYVKKACIILNQNNLLNMASHYEKLSNLGQINIFNVKTPINFITSVHLYHLFVSYPPDIVGDTHSNIDLVLPVLRISEKIHKFGYNGGALTYASILHLSYNPIETMMLRNVYIEDIDAFTEFLTNAPHLINLFLMGEYRLDSQKGYFHESNRARHQTKYLRITYSDTLLTEYARITECINLTYIGLHYFYSDNIEKLFEFLLTLPNLKEIAMKPKFPHVEQETYDEEEYVYQKYMILFFKRGMILTRDPPSF